MIYTFPSTHNENKLRRTTTAVQKPEILTMKAKKVYPCPVCFKKGKPYVCPDLGNWYKHLRTSKHKNNLAKKENSANTINGQLNATNTGDSSKSISQKSNITKKSNFNGNMPYDKIPGDVQKTPDDNNDIASTRKALSTTGTTKSTKLAKSTSSEISTVSATTTTYNHFKLLIQSPVTLRPQWHCLLKQRQSPNPR